MRSAARYGAPDLPVWYVGLTFGAWYCPSIWLLIKFDSLSILVYIISLFFTNSKINNSLLFSIQVFAYMTILIGDRCAVKFLYFSNKDRVKNYCNSFTSAQLYESGNCGIERWINSIINLVQTKEQYCMLEIYSYPIANNYRPHINVPDLFIACPVWLVMMCCNI
jgi:hypothetical protein